MYFISLYVVYIFYNHILHIFLSHHAIIEKNFWRELYDSNLFVTHLSTVESLYLTMGIPLDGNMSQYSPHSGFSPHICCYIYFTFIKPVDWFPYQKAQRSSPHT